ncbi:hypothetical protein DET57_10197 [Klebsiella oxytoca]|uniref:CadC family transcriptional regulator n=1 Tax=Klebsiella oxytoca TaxID=571 RepID=A0A318G8R1_KLEOX|nr:hypothetical protein [Klebsiella oxytoca]PXW49399.1 hypothetical protein DET57_10197 [Klebsiella oxytoca]HCB1498031.1 hypothetical protein [Klebsiella michiganensis]HCB1843726.1 hypothetical protein [Klebsiella oxytoca]
MTQNPGRLDHHLYGYCIGDNLEFRISPALLVNTLTGISIRLRPTMARLLSYILNHSNEKMIEDEKIMRDVFENYGLKCNKQRLWQAINSLKKTLVKCGFSRFIIYRVNNNGFLVSNVRIGMLLCYSLNSNHIEKSETKKKHENNF